MGRATKYASGIPKNAPVALPGAVVERYHKCGKARCRCASGELHGPYFRRQWYEGGRLRSAYVRRRDVARVRVACALYRQQHEDDRRLMREALGYSRLSARELIARLREIEGWN